MSGRAIVIDTLKTEIARIGKMCRLEIAGLRHEVAALNARLDKLDKPVNTRASSGSSRKGSRTVPVPAKPKTSGSKKPEAS